MNNLYKNFIIACVSIFIILIICYYFCYYTQKNNDIIQNEVNTINNNGNDEKKEEINADIISLNDVSKFDIDTSSDIDISSEDLPSII